MKYSLLFMAYALFCSCAQAGDKYALLVAVRKYDHPDMNQPLLQYPEVDARSMNDLLQLAGYEVDLLLGKDATQDNVRKKLSAFSEKGGNKGVALVGLFGHGIEFAATKKSYFCPYDTTVKARRDDQGRVISDDNGNPRVEPDEKKLVSIDEVLLALRESKATNRILLADCCRNDPNAARGRSFGTSLQINQLPQNTAVMFACSAQEKAYEHQEWGHGAFTKCLLDAIRDRSDRGETLLSFIAADVEPAVEKLVSAKVDATQTPRLLLTGARVDLQLNGRASFEGAKAGDAKELVPGIAFRWCPAGTYLMSARNGADDRSRIKVTLSSGFWLGETELTQGQWQNVMATRPWSGKQYVKEGANIAASYISHSDAVAYCERLTTTERSAGRLPKGWKYSPPTEAQWEYACRAGTQTKYAYGDSEDQLGDYEWYVLNAYDAGEQYAHQVGLKKSNPWGFKDMQGNVREWCSDWYSIDVAGGKNPVGPAGGSERVFRGGCWGSEGKFCGVDLRAANPADHREYYIGFRPAAVPERRTEPAEE